MKAECLTIEEMADAIVGYEVQAYGVVQGWFNVAVDHSEAVDIAQRIAEASKEKAERLNALHD